MAPAIAATLLVVGFALLRLSGDLVHAHAACGPGDGPVIQVRNTDLVFGHLLRVEGAGAIARDRQMHLRRPVSTVFFEWSLRRLVVAVPPLLLELLVQFGAENAVPNALLRIVEQTILGTPFTAQSALMYPHRPSLLETTSRTKRGLHASPQRASRH